MECPDEMTLQDYADGEAARAEAEAIARHVRECPVCSPRLEEIRRVDAAARRAMKELASRAGEVTLPARREARASSWKWAAAAAVVLAAAVWTWQRTGEDRQVSVPGPAIAETTDYNGGTAYMWRALAMSRGPSAAEMEKLSAMLDPQSYDPEGYFREVVKLRGTGGPEERMPSWRVEQMRLMLSRAGGSGDGNSG